jgi:hypothetical protein
MLVDAFAVDGDVFPPDGGVHVPAGPSSDVMPETVATRESAAMRETRIDILVTSRSVFMR